MVTRGQDSTASGINDCAPPECIDGYRAVEQEDEPMGNLARAVQQFDLSQEFLAKLRLVRFVMMVERHGAGKLSGIDNRKSWIGSATLRWIRCDGIFEHRGILVKVSNFHGGGLSTLR